MGLFRGKGGERQRGVDTGEEKVRDRLVSECYCHNGHSLLSDLATYDGLPGLTMRLRAEGRQGMLSLSPIIGDKSRRFFEFERNEGEVVEICCPTCDEPLPVYNLCPCGADLVTLFTTPRAEFSNVIGICRRLGCLHAEILSGREMRLYSRQGFF